jgi:hypothetical protein
VGIAEWIPYFLASYEQVLTTPLPDPPLGSESTTTGSPFNSDLSLTFTDAKKVIHIYMKGILPFRSFYFIIEADITVKKAKHLKKA